MTAHKAWFEQNYEHDDDFDPLLNPDDPRTCQECQGAGVVWHVTLILGRMVEKTCLDCGGTGLAG